MEDMNKGIKKFCNGQVVIWLEQDSSIMIKAVNKEYGDPVEMEADEAIELAKMLKDFAEYILQN